MMRIARHNDIDLNMTSTYACFYMHDTAYTLGVVAIEVQVVAGLPLYIPAQHSDNLKIFS